MEKLKKIWQTSRREFDCGEKTLVMAILNVTPDSFSDGGKFKEIDAALFQAEKLIAAGADILDIGGESTRPKAARVSASEETKRVVPVIEAVAKRFDTAISIDTSKSEVATRAVEAGAEIINDISGLRFDAQLAETAAAHKTGLILMHLRGEFETMHNLEPVADIMREVTNGFRRSIEKARGAGVESQKIALDVGVGFSKTFAQNLELLAKIGDFENDFAGFPLLVGASRKSFLGKILGEDDPRKRVNASVAAAAIAVYNGASIVRVHDVGETGEAVKVADALKKSRNMEKFR